ncbi:pentatricopeptide repeat protein, partial [Aspergillus sclerotialis]
MTKYKLPLRCRTKGLLVYGKSLNGDWEGVKQGLEEMCDSTTIIVKPRDFLQIFDRIFLEYWVSHTGPEIHDFIFYYIDKFRLVPDRVLYKHILEA